MGEFVPLSVRYGNRRKKLAWWWSGQRERLAFRLAPWLNVPLRVRAKEHVRCNRHPDRNAISLTDDGRLALCAECHRLWLNAPTGSAA